MSSAHDQLALIVAELAAATGDTGALHDEMQQTQHVIAAYGEHNLSLGWLLDSTGRYWYRGDTAGFHAFIGFDPKTRHGVVVLASTSTPLLEQLPDLLYATLEGNDNASPLLPQRCTALRARRELPGRQVLGPHPRAGGR